MEGWIHALTALLCVHLATTGVPGKAKLSPYIKHYEVLTYDSNELNNDHERVRREAGLPIVYLKFRAHNKDFKIRLQQESTVFVDKPELQLAPDHIVPLDVSHLYEGDLEGEAKTHVHGSIIDGVFAGFITTPEEGYTVERADAYFTEPQKFHSIIYRDSHMDIDPHRSKRSTHRKHFCASTEPDVKYWMHEQKAALIREAEELNTLLKESSNDYPGPDSTWEKQESQPHNKYLPPKDRVKRAALSKGMCNLFMRSDTILWEHYTGIKEANSLNLGYSEERARKEITSLFSYLVTEVNKIYESTEFSNTDNSINHSGISLKIHRVRVNETAKDCPTGTTNPLCNRNIDVHNFLNFNSLENNTEFCLAYTLTFRDFEAGTLGLAWTGDPGEAPGGICDTYKKYQAPSGNGYQMKGLNTGIVSILNYNIPVVPKVSVLTLAHEIGHNFGSPHDYPSRCQPYTANQDPLGNFLMYASATTGDQSNNKKFSDCSRSNISLVIDALIQNKFGKINCLKSRTGAFCGNQITEVGEECDCGYLDDCNAAKDTCCTPRSSDSSAGCTLRSGKNCSPSEGPCCADNCEKVPSSASQECAPASDCQERATCDGNSVDCPTQVNKQENTPCNRNTQVCKKGVCEGSICDLINWTQCYLTTTDLAENQKTDVLCFLACKNPSTETCISTGDSIEMGKAENTALHDLITKTLTVTSLELQPGSPCDDLKGYCDALGFCIKVDADGIINRLKNFFNQQTFEQIQDWIIKNWWAVLLMGVGLIVIMGIFIKVCAVHTPSHNPNKKPARRLTNRDRHRNEHGHRDHDRRDRHRDRRREHHHDRPRDPYQDHKSHHSSSHHGSHHSRGQSNPAYGGSRDYPDSHYSRPPPYEYM